MPFINFTLF